jgi:Putative auto-transporter adhesin, head GIN domain
MSVEGERMRTFLPALCATLAIASPAAGATRNFGITDFTKVRIEGPYSVTFTTGVAPYARGSGSQTALDRLAIEVRGDTLVVRTDRSAWGGYPGADPGPVEVSVGTHDLSSASLTGAGSIAINRVTGLSFALSVQGSGAARIDEVAADQFSVSLGGTASARLVGTAKKLNAALRGLSTLDAAKLSTPNVDVSAEGSATIDAVAAQTARVDASGPTTIRFSGKPSCELHVNGSASVSGCK